MTRIGTGRARTIRNAFVAIMSAAFLVPDLISNPLSAAEPTSDVLTDYKKLSATVSERLKAGDLTVFVEHSFLASDQRLSNQLEDAKRRTEKLQRRIVKATIGAAQLVCAVSLASATFILERRNDTIELRRPKQKQARDETITIALERERVYVWFGSRWYILKNNHRLRSNLVLLDVFKLRPVGNQRPPPALSVTARNCIAQMKLN